MAHRVTLKDIARETGLSESAVSQVLNNRDCRLSEENKRLIQQTAARLNYRPNRIARGLATNKSDTIGLIVPDIENPFFSSLAKRMEECCRSYGKALFIANSDDRASHDAEQLARFDALGVDGIVFVPSNENPDEPDEHLLSVLESLSAPFVMVDRVIERVGCDKVVVDNELGAYRAVSHLISFGHSRIGCLANTRHSQNGRLRLSGYKSALAEVDIPFNPLLVRECDYHDESGYAEVEPLLKQGITAVFSTSDLITVGVMARLGELGLNVPEDVSLVSFDRNDASALFLPRMTSVSQNVRALAANAFDLLMRRIDGDVNPPRLCQLEPDLILGNSVAVPTKI